MQPEYLEAVVQGGLGQLEGHGADEEDGLNPHRLVRAAEDAARRLEHLAL